MNNYHPSNICLAALKHVISRAIVPLVLIAGCNLPVDRVIAQQSIPLRRVNVVYWDWAAGTPYPSHSIFWFGEVGPSSNSVDVRMIYYNEHLEIVTHIVDRNLYQSDPVKGIDLTKWDAISVYLSPTGNSGQFPALDDHRFDVQLGQWSAPEYSQRAFRGDGAGWSIAPIAFTATASWRGTDGPNSGGDSKGWTATIIIPFSSLGLGGPPRPGTLWGLGLSVHDRDDAAGPPHLDQTWPETLNPQRPATWGQLHFGVSTYSRPTVTPVGTTTVRQGLDGAMVPDAHVGGHTTCGDGIDHWSAWGLANYASYNQINIQNQWDISDYPCFSKYYVTFPLEKLPPGKTIISATLTMYLFGNAGYAPGDSQPSAIQALTVAEDWDEKTINWNNAPLAVENIALTWVYAVDFFDPGVPYTWDVSKAVADAYATGQPLRLALYSADGERHSGKYFWSSDADEPVRPTLHVRWGDPDNGTVPSVPKSDPRVYLPLVIR